MKFAGLEKHRGTITGRHANTRHGAASKVNACDPSNGTARQPIWQQNETEPRPRENEDARVPRVTIDLLDDVPHTEYRAFNIAQENTFNCPEIDRILRKL